MPIHIAVWFVGLAKYHTLKELVEPFEQNATHFLGREIKYYPTNYWVEEP